MSKLGFKHSEETKLKFRTSPKRLAAKEAQKGKVPPKLKEHIEKRRGQPPTPGMLAGYEKNRGRQHTEEAKAKISSTHKAKPRSSAQLASHDRAKGVKRVLTPLMLEKSLLRRGKSTSMKGRPPTDKMIAAGENRRGKETIVRGRPITQKQADSYAAKKLRRPTSKQILAYLEMVGRPKTKSYREKQSINALKRARHAFVLPPLNELEAKYDNDPKAKEHLNQKGYSKVDLENIHLIPDPISDA